MRNEKTIPLIAILATGCLFGGGYPTDLPPCTQMVVVEGYAELDLTEPDGPAIRWTGTEDYYHYNLDDVSGDFVEDGEFLWEVEGELVSPTKDLADASEFVVDIVASLADSQDDTPTEDVLTTYTYDKTSGLIRVTREVCTQDGSFEHEMEVTSMNRNQTADGLVLIIEYTDTYYMSSDGECCSLDNSSSSGSGDWPDACGGPAVNGIDVSYWQSTIDWSSVASAGVEFAFIRVSDGIGVDDTEFSTNWNEARANGIVRGAYQYFRACQDPRAQAELLLEKMGNLEYDDLPPVIDVETTDDCASSLISNMQEWLNIVEDAVGRKPIIYTSWGFWDGSVGGYDFSEYPLWVANWEVDCPVLPDGWSDWVFWQSSDSGSIPGIYGNVDMDIFNGSYDDLLDFAMGG